MHFFMKFTGFHENPLKYTSFRNAHSAAEPFPNEAKSSLHIPHPRLSLPRPWAPRGIRGPEEADRIRPEQRTRGPEQGTGGPEQGTGGPEQ